MYRFVVVCHMFRPSNLYDSETLIQNVVVKRLTLLRIQEVTDSNLVPEICYLD
jgi:hypothetical protein